MVRFLRTPNREQIRLGWLPVICNIIGLERRDLRGLGEQLASQSSVFQSWAKQAGLDEGPLGNIQKSRPDKLIRIAITYNVYDEQSETLTDLGHVIRLVDPWSFESKKSPLQWIGSKRWIGLWTVIQASGDVIIEIMRKWPITDRVSAKDAESLILSVLQNLIHRTSSEDQLVIKKQLARVAQERSLADWLVYPYVEPLRDLGYLIRRNDKSNGVYNHGSYYLTYSGTRLREALLKNPADANTLLRKGLSRIFLYAEEFASVKPADGMIIAETLTGLPPELKVSDLEAPLEATVLLAQSHLINKRAACWIDKNLAHAIVRNVETNSAGKVYLKRGQSIAELNIAWTNPAVLHDSALWKDAVPLDISAKTENTSSVQGETQAEVKPSGETRDSLPQHEGPSLKGAADSASVPTPILPAEIPAVHETVRIPPTHETLLDEGIPGSLRLWLQYVAAILAPPITGGIDLHVWGGPITVLSRLKSLLGDLPEDRIKEKRQRAHDFISSPEVKKPAVCLIPLVRIQRACKGAEGGWLFDAINDRWHNVSVLPRSLMATIERGLAIAPFLHEELRARIDEFIKRTGEIVWKDWPLIRDATRFMVHDSIFTGRWRADLLCSQLLSNLSKVSIAQAARELLDQLTEKNREYGYEQSFLVKDSVAALLCLDELADYSKKGEKVAGIEVTPCKVTDDDVGKLKYQMRMSVSAHSWHEGLTVGRSRVHALLVSRHYQLASPQTRGLVELPREAVDEHIWDNETQTELSTTYTQSSRVPGLSFSYLHGAPQGQPVKSWREVLEELCRPPREDGSPGSWARFVRAIRGLALARDPERSPPERLILGWSAVEQLVSSGDESKTSTVVQLAAAASILQFRGEFRRIYLDARAGLLAAVALRPESIELQALVGNWLPSLKPALATMVAAPNTVARSRLAAGNLPTIPACSDSDVIAEIFKNRTSLNTLRIHLEANSPLAAEGIYHIMDIFGDNTQRRKKDSSGGISQPAKPKKSELSSHTQVQPQNSQEIQSAADTSPTVLIPPKSHTSSEILQEASNRDRPKQVVGNPIESTKGVAEDGENLSGVSTYFRSIYEDMTSFFSHIYEIRNRFVHSGEGFDSSREPATGEVFERFYVLIDPIISSLESRLQKPGTDLESFWHLAQDLAHDLASLRTKDQFTSRRLVELLNF